MNQHLIFILVGLLGASLAHAVTIGPRIERACFGQLKNEGLNRAKVLTLLDQRIEQAKAKIIRCGEVYPELEVYTKQWLKVVSESNLNCSIFAKHKEFELIEAAFDNPSKTFFVNAETFLVPFLQAGVGINTFIHEYLHGSLANNMANHNDLEVAQGDYCPSIYNVDRVYLLEHFCFADNTQGPAISSMILYGEIKNCGTEKGCENIFNGTYNDLTSQLKTTLGSQDLTKEQAKKLCRRIDDTNSETIEKRRASRVRP